MEHFRVTWHSFFLSLTMILHNLVSHPEQVFAPIILGIFFPLYVYHVHESIALASNSLAAKHLA